MNNLSRLIAWRYLFSNRQRFVPLLTLVAVSGITLGVWSLMVVLSVMRGFQSELNQRWIGLNSHLSVAKFPLQGSDYQSLKKILAAWPEVSEVAATVEGEVIVQVPKEGEFQAAAAKLKGVERLAQDFLSKVQIYPTELPDFENAAKEEPPPLMGGDELLSLLGVHPDFEETVTVVYPLGEIGPTGDFLPKQKKFKVTHVFRTGLYEWDSYRLLVPLHEAQALLGDQGETSLQIWLKNLSDLSKVEKRLRLQTPPQYPVMSFAKQNQRLFAALKLERIAMTLLLILFGLIASFSITGLLLMFLSAKRRDLAILRSIGLSMRGARHIFLHLGFLLGGIGALLGGLLGGLTCYLLDRYPIPLPSTYYLDHLPVQFHLPQMAVIMVIGLLLALVSSLYPVGIASRMDPLPMLREE